MYIYLFQRHKVNAKSYKRNNHGGLFVHATQWGIISNALNVSKPNIKLVCVYICGIINLKTLLTLLLVCSYVHKYMHTYNGVCVWFLYSSAVECVAQKIMQPQVPQQVAYFASKHVICIFTASPKAYAAIKGANVKHTNVPIVSFGVFSKY